MSRFQVPSEFRLQTRTAAIAIVVVFALGALWAWSRSDAEIGRLKEAGRKAEAAAQAREDSALATIDAMNDSLKAIKKQKQRVITVAVRDSVTVAKLDSVLAQATTDSARIAILTEQNAALKSETTNLWAAVALADSATANAERQRDEALDALREQTREVFRLNSQVQSLTSRMPTWVRVGTYVVTFAGGVYVGARVTP